MASQAITGQPASQRETNSDLPLLKMYGERNTGTNYLMQLVELNLRVRMLPGVISGFLDTMRKVARTEFIPDLYFAMTFGRNLGWKHMLVKQVDDLQRYAITSRNLSFVTLTKNPYSWLLSLHRRPYHQFGFYRSMMPPFRYKELSFAEFLNTPWHTVRRECAPASFPNPIELWNQKTRAYLQLGARFPVLNLKYESLLDQPQQVIEQIRDRFGYEPLSEEFQNYEESTKESSKDHGYYRDYYLNQKWKSKLTAADIEFVNRHVDEELLRHFDYERLS